jgi:UDP-3-O-[3-hydroxymyristoyl] glucosamine N-acyltransferase
VRPGRQGPFSAAELAGFCGGRLVGDGDRIVRAVRSLDRAGGEDLSFVADRKAEKLADRSAAGVLLARSAGPFAGRTVIEVADPALALIPVLEAFYPRRTASPSVHPTAIVGAGAVVDSGAEVGPYAVIGAGSRIGAGAIVEAHVVVGCGSEVGAGAWLHPHVVLYDGVVVGPRTEVHSGTVLGADGFGYAPSPSGIRKVPQVGTVEIGADAEIGANSCVDRAALEVTRVGDGTKVDDLVMVGHNCVIGRHDFICAQTGLAGSTVVGDGVVLGGQVGVAGHLRIGNGVKVGAQSGVNGDVPDGADINLSPHMPYRDSMKCLIEFRRLPETARLVRELARAAGKSTEKP